MQKKKIGNKECNDMYAIINLQCKKHIETYCNIDIFEMKL